MILTNYSRVLEVAHRGWHWKWRTTKLGWSWTRRSRALIRSRSNLSQAVLERLSTKRGGHRTFLTTTIFSGEVKGQQYQSYEPTSVFNLRDTPLHEVLCTWTTSPCFASLNENAWRSPARHSQTCLPLWQVSLVPLSAHFCHISSFHWPDGN